MGTMGGWGNQARQRGGVPAGNDPSGKPLGTSHDHTMDGNSRAKLGHSLGGELQRDSNDFLDGLSIPTSQVTGAADVVAPLTWTCSDADLHRHMRLVLEQLCSDKTQDMTIVSC